MASWWDEQVTPAGDKPASPQWDDLRQQAMNLLEQEARLQQIVRLVGADSLPDRQRWVLDAARLLEEGFLQQNALHAIDAYAVPAKQLRLLRLLWNFAQGRGLVAIGVPLLHLREKLDTPRLLRLKESVPNDNVDEIDHVRKELQTRLRALADEYRQRRQP
ncbi:MAG: hypothetical protein R2911_05675 [Caldilineaceae bacterium]